jgi:hypothetical protein
VNDIIGENDRVSQHYLKETVKNKTTFNEFCRLKRATSKECYVLLSEEKSVKTTINIKKQHIFSALFDFNEISYVGRI